jgi:hypothetical protein
MFSDCAAEDSVCRADEVIAPSGLDVREDIHREIWSLDLESKENWRRRYQLLLLSLERGGRGEAEGMCSMR